MDCRSAVKIAGRLAGKYTKRNNARRPAPRLCRLWINCGRNLLEVARDGDDVGGILVLTEGEAAQDDLALLIGSELVTSNGTVLALGIDKEIDTSGPCIILEAET